jgi:hypothetical protein
MSLDEAIDLITINLLNGFEDRTRTKQTILKDLLDIIGEDEEQPRPFNDENRCRFYRVGGKNFVRNELREAVRKYCE